MQLSFNIFQQPSTCHTRKTNCGVQLNFKIFRQPSTCHARKTNCIELKTTDPEIYSILIFQKRVWKQFLHHILCMSFQQKCFSCYILLTEQISLSNYVYFLRYWTIYVLQLFVSQGVTSKILKLTLSFESSCFYT